MQKYSTRVQVKNEMEILNDFIKEVIKLYEDDFIIRISELRNNKGVSAREMSISIGQNPGYINDIESGKSMPSMNAFFYICEYLDITPKEFFDTEFSTMGKDLKEVITCLDKMPPEMFERLSYIIKALSK